MLNWIRKLVEKRQGDYSSQVLNNAWSNYTDISSNPLQTAAVESAAGLYQLSFQEQSPIASYVRMYIHCTQIVENMKHPLCFAPSVIYGIYTVINSL